MLVQAVTKPKTPTPASASTPSPSPTTTQPANSGSSLIQSRPYSDEVRQIYNAVVQKINAAPITAQDIMSSPEYKALEDAMRFNMQRAQAGLDRSFASRGMLRSTPMVQAANESAAYYTAQLNQQIPALIEQEYNRRQRDIANAVEQLRLAMGMDDNAFNRGVTEFQVTAPYTRPTIAQQMDQERFNKTFEENRRQSDRAFGLQEAAVTGQYQPEAVRQLLDTIFRAKESWANPNDGTTPEQDNARATAARNALLGMGFTQEQIDSLVGPNVTLEQARANLARFTLPTMQARQTEAQMFGTYGGRPTLQGRQTEQALRMGDLEYQIATNPQYGLAAQAATQQRLRELEARRAQLLADIESDQNLGLRAERQRELARLDAEIAATRALEAQRVLSAQSQTQEAAERARRQALNDLEVYDVTPTARNVWLDLMNEYNNIVTQTGTIDRERAAELMRLAQRVPGLTSKDKAWLATMHASYFGDTAAGGTLYTYLRGYKPPEDDPLRSLMQ